MTRDEIRHKIDYEIIVDCYDDYEVNMGWFYFFEEAVEFPFEAEMQVKTRSGIARPIKVDVLGLATQDGDFNIPELAFEVSLKDSEIIMEANISKLKKVEGTPSTKQAFLIWAFWESGDY